jgi:hypothetical protein
VENFQSMKHNWLPWLPLKSTGHMQLKPQANFQIFTAAHKWGLWSTIHKRMVFVFSRCDWQGTLCYGSHYAALTSKFNVIIRACLSPTQAGFQLWVVIVKCSLDSNLAIMHEQLSIYLLQCTKMNSKLGLLLEFLKHSKLFS